MFLRRFLLILVLIAVANAASAQRFLMDMVDTTTEVGRGIFSMYKEYGHLRFSGYMQPQFQWAEDKGIETYSGGNFAPNSNNRFMFRRGRIRMEYTHFTKEQLASTHFVFQFDGTERGVNIRDFWGRMFENKLQMFSVTTGMFARPFGFEVNLSSTYREAPERGRMSQILMKTERDLGVMLTFNPRKSTAKLKWLKADIGVFNGQGLAGPMEYDSAKDIIGRLSTKHMKVKPLGIIVSAGASVLYGGIVSQSPWEYSMQTIGGQPRMVGDSAPSNINYLAPRHYYGADMQIKIPNKKGATEFRAEYITGMQTGTAETSETPGTYPVKSNLPQPLYTRRFDGAYFYYLQHLFSEKHQFLAKYDWYDPNKDFAGNTVAAANGATVADVRYDTWGVGYIYYANPHLKLVLFYDGVTNEHTALPGYTADRPDNVFTCRVQYTF